MHSILNIDWRKSSKSVANGQCVEVMRLDGTAPVAASEDAGQPLPVYGA